MWWQGLTMGGGVFLTSKLHYIFLVKVGIEVCCSAVLSVDCRSAIVNYPFFFIHSLLQQFRDQWTCRWGVLTDLVLRIKKNTEAHVFCLCSGIQMGNLTLPLLFAKILVEGVVLWPVLIVSDGREIYCSKYKAYF